MLSDDSRTRRIKEIVIKAYENDEEVNRQVREEVMDWWDKAGGYHLFRMGEIMKSQQKASKQKIKALKYHSCHFMALWYEQLTERYGMTGRPSTEGAENKHHWLNEQTKACINSSDQR